MPYKNPEDAKKNKRKYYLENKDKLKEKSRQYYYENRNKIIANVKKYQEEHKEEREKYFKEWCKMNKRESDKRYLSTEKGKLAHRKANAKRKRNLKFEPLFANPFPNDIDMDYHHINNLITIPIPRKLHRLNYGNNHREKCNELIMDLYGINIDNILRGD